MAYKTGIVWYEYSSYIHHTSTLTSFFNLYSWDLLTSKTCFILPSFFTCTYFWYVWNILYYLIPSSFILQILIHLSCYRFLLKVILTDAQNPDECFSMCSCNIPGFKCHVIYHLANYLFFPVCFASLRVDTVLTLFDVINIAHAIINTYPIEIPQW